MVTARLIALALVVGVAALSAQERSHAVGLVVNATGDGSDFTSGDGVCETTPGDGVCTLRAAMEESNALAGHDVISFNIPAASDPGCDSGSGICTIVTDAELPPVSDVTIDGYTQPGATANSNGADDGSNAQLKIELRAQTAGGLSVALDIGDNSAVRGLWLDWAVVSVLGNDANVVAGNFFTNPDAASATGNTIGVRVTGSANAIGGSDPPDRNVISSPTLRGVLIDGAGNTVEGNLIGTDPSGTVRVGSRDFGVLICAANNVIGGTSAGARNVISGGNTIAVLSGGPCEDQTPDGIVIQGNYLGADIAGNPLGNLSDINLGMAIDVRGNTLIGGTGPGESNLIAYNQSDGVSVGLQPGHPPAVATIRGNSIHSNRKLGIDDHVDLTLPPVITSVTPIGGATMTIAGTACTSCTVDVYSDAANEGQTYHGSSIASGAGSWSLTVAVNGPAVTATATSPAGGTSSFTGYAIDGSADEDGDGYTHGHELSMGTVPTIGCSLTMTANDEDPDMAPPDFDDNRAINISDVLALKPVFGGVSSRHDLVPSGGVINISDVLALKPIFGFLCPPGSEL